MDDDLEFTDDEIRDELSKLGYRSIPSERLQEFKKGKRIQMTSLDYVRSSVVCSNVDILGTNNGIAIF